MTKAKAQASPWRDWVLRLERVRAGDLAANSENWRRHPQAQVEALKGMLSEVGFAGALLAYQDDGKLTLIDGHLRAGLDPEAEVPVLVLDVDRDEARKLLATYDTLGAMAQPDQDALLALLQSVDTQSQAVKDMLEALANGSYAPLMPMLPLHEVRPTLADRFIVPPFSVLDARQGYWQERKRAWLSLGIQSELGRGETTRADSPGDHRPGAEGNGQYAGGDSFRYHHAAPGGSLRDAMSLGTDGKTVRGDGKGRRLTWVPGAKAFGELDDTSRKILAASGRGPGRCFGQDLMRGEHILGDKSKAFKAQSRQTALQKTGDSRIGATVSSAKAMDYAGGYNEDQKSTGTSIFDPVLCELVYRWFSPQGGLVLDPFAGGSVRGLVASLLKRRYIGVDLRKEQVAANRAQEYIAKDPLPIWIIGDSRNLKEVVGDIAADLIFTCPPYFDLEQYSDEPADISNAVNYNAFLVAYRNIIMAAVALLKPDRFACVCVGDIRDKKGFYRNFVSDTIATFQETGAILYNEAILVLAVGSLSIRVGRQFTSGRKLGKTHQNILVFVKGNPKNATAACGPIEVSVGLEILPSDAPASLEEQDGALELGLPVVS